MKIPGTAAAALFGAALALPGASAFVGAPLTKLSVAHPSSSLSFSSAARTALPRYVSAQYQQQQYFHGSGVNHFFLWSIFSIFLDERESFCFFLLWYFSLVLFYVARILRQQLHPPPPTPTPPCPPHPSHHPHSFFIPRFCFCCCYLWCTHVVGHESNRPTVVSMVAGAVGNRIERIKGTDKEGLLDVNRIDR